MHEAFLVRRAAEDLAERLEAIPRRFERALILGAPALFVEALAARPALKERIGALEKADVVAELADGGAGIDLDHLPYAEQAFDLIVSPLLLHQANDLVGMLIQLKRALKPDGLLLASLFGGATLNELRTALLQAEIEIKGGAGPRVAPFADVIDLAGLLQRAGYALPAADRDQIVVRYREPLTLLTDLRAMGETNALMQRAGPLTRGVLARALQIYRERFPHPDGGVAATFEIVTLTGWAPHESQQKPLKPGSAQTRLADALGVLETKLPREIE
ncbi:MAG: methyltransferase domain-containing protein [Hyphomonadaceae bacterium]